VVVYHGDSIQDFWLSYRVEFGFGPKTTFYPCDLFCYKKSTKKSTSGSILTCIDFLPIYA
jgi:hypothetical protein